MCYNFSQRGVNMVKLAEQQETKEKKVKITKEKVLKVISFLIPLGTPFICFMALEFLWRLSIDGVLKVNPIVYMSPTLILLNLLLFYAFWLIIFAIFRRTKVASCVLIVLSFVIGLANFYIMIFRNYPIMATDFLSLKTALAVGGSYSFAINKSIVFIGISCIALFVLNLFFSFKLPQMRKTYSKILIRVIPIVFSLAIIFGITSVVSRDDVKSIISGYNSTLFDRVRMTEDDGLILSFVSSIHYAVVDKPDGYSEDAAKKILNKYSDDSVWNTTTVSKTTDKSAPIKTKVKKANVVAIMNECFSDVGILGNLKTNMDYMPFTRKLMSGSKDTISGYFYSSVIAGSTANTEFEFLTGDTMAFLPPCSIPYQQHIYNQTDSMASLLAEQGYSTNATHPYVSYAWNRINIYPLLGFENIKFARDMTGLTQIRIYNDDASYYKYLKQNIFNTTSPYFSFGVTMQNHGGYTGTFDNFAPNVHMTNSVSQPTDTYLSLIKKSDEQFKDLIDYFKKIEDPTIVIMFGDHQPNDYVVDPIYQLKGKTAESLTPAERFERYKVPVIIWANYDIPEDSNLLTSANYMGGIVTKLAGCKTSSYQNFLENLRDEIPVICAQGFTLKDGKYKDLSELDKYSDKINDYRILNYYNIFADSSKQ